jgi:hypothetical protein
MKLRLLSILLLLVVGLTLTAAMLIGTNQRDDFLATRAELVVRQIGHDLLLHAGDSTSRVMPVKKTSPGSFKLDFENQFSFMPDSLVAIVHRSLGVAHLPMSYLVQVFDCNVSEMVYGFEVWAPSQKVEPCLGRVQPTGCYTIKITFTAPTKSAGISAGYYYYGTFGLLGIAVIAFVWLKYPSARTSSAVNESITRVGTLHFDETNGYLKREDKIIQLSNKESKLLKILVSNVNRLVDRDQLQNEIWMSEGVITGRSLDMFISKLRKKLSDDSSIKIVNVHGRGNKLECSK